MCALHKAKELDPSSLNFERCAQVLTGWASWPDGKWDTLKTEAEAKGRKRDLDVRGQATKVGDREMVAGDAEWVMIDPLD